MTNLRSDRSFRLSQRMKRRITDIRELLLWLRHGRGSPSPRLLKQRVVRGYQKSPGLNVLIETGTFYGDMIEATKNTFGRIISIELDADLFSGAQERFRYHPHISVIHGDSAKVLERILVEVSEPCLFWLDAHYSGGETARGELETPIEKELELIFARRNPADIILIDDARLFTGVTYPALESLEHRAASSHLRSFEVTDDIIRIRAVGDSE